MNNGITVIVTTYNNNNCIRECLLSVINQTQSPKSIIVIDDCSEDILTLKEIIYSLNNTSNIKIELLINEKNSGPGFSRNKAWGLVNTDLVAFLDADDIYYKNKLELQLSILKKYPEANVIGGQKSRHNTKINKEINNTEGFFISGFDNISRVELEDLYFLRSEIAFKLMGKNDKSCDDLNKALELDFQSELIKEKINEICH